MKKFLLLLTICAPVYGMKRLTKYITPQRTYSTKKSNILHHELYALQIAQEHLYKKIDLYEKLNSLCEDTETKLSSVSQEKLNQFSHESRILIGTIINSLPTQRDRDLTLESHENILTIINEQTIIIAQKIADEQNNSNLKD